MSDLDKFFEKALSFAAKASKAALENPDRVYIAFDMLGSAIDYADTVLDDWGKEMTPEQELAAYERHDAFLTEQKAIMKAKRAALK